MKVLVTGGTGFTGSYVVQKLLERGFQVRCFVRPSSDRSRLPQGRLEVAIGDLGQSEQIRAALAGCRTLVNVASLGFGHARGVVEAASACGVDRAVFFSSTSIFTSLEAKSKALRLEAEQAVFESGLNFTLLRPTMIYGSSRDRNICRLIRFLSKWPVVPIPGDGRASLQPVYVADLAEAVLRCLDNPATIGKAYDLSGAEPVTFNQAVSTICRLLGRRVWKMHIPFRPVAGVLRALERLPLRLPVKAEQVARLNEDKAFSHQAAKEDFGYEPLRFEEGLRLELQEMGLA